MPITKSRGPRRRRPAAVQYLREKFGIEWSEKTLANRNAAGQPPRPEYLGSIPYYSEEELDRFGETAFRSESPVAVTRRRHKAIFTQLLASRDDPDDAPPPAGASQG